MDNKTESVDLRQLLLDICMDKELHPILQELDACLQKLAPLLDDDKRKDVMCTLLATIHKIST